ncbi:Fc.00g072980.m01.CDS01 [Cosmosporella sp. VM-42]
MDPVTPPAEGQPQVKISVACDTCRLRKRKCDGVRPACTGCQRFKKSCHYRDASGQPTFVFKAVHFSGSTNEKRRKLSDNGERSGPKPKAAAPAELPIPFLLKDLGSETPTPDIPGDQDTLMQPDQPSRVRIPFFRWFGPTGIAPGYKKYMTEVNFTSNPEEHLSAPPVNNEATGRFNGITNSLFGNSELEAKLFDPEDNLTPVHNVLFPLLETFFDYFGCHFPFHSREIFIASVAEKKVPSILLNSMCAMAARFSSLPIFDGQLAYLRGEVFAHKAKALLVPLLNLPSYEVVESILMIAWMEMATCHDAGLWMYTGMAVRMAEDLGMHKQGTLPLGDSSNSDERLLYWAVNFLDHIISFATGRPLTTRRDYIDVKLPTETPVSDTSPELPSPFPGMIRIIQMQGLVNEEIGMLSEQSVDIPPDTRRRLITYGGDLVANYTSMHPLLAFDVPNFRAHASNGQGGTFLLLHLWFNSVMIALHRPGLRFGQDNQRSGNLLCSDSRQISLSAARTSSSCLVLAELVDNKSILASPFIDQAVQMAGLVFIAELRIPPTVSPAQSNMAEIVEKHICQSNYQVCLRTLQSLMTYWRGIGWILTAMEQKFQGIKDTDPGEFNVDPHSSVPLSDRKMILRLLRASYGHDQAPGIHWPQSTIGIAVAGTTNSASKHTVTVLESSELKQGQVSSSAESAIESDNSFSFDDDLVWTSWLDDGLWDIDFDKSPEYF